MSRYIPPGKKDASGAFLKDGPAPSIPTPTEEDLQLSTMLNKYLEILYRETRHLLVLSAMGKLSKEDAACMRDNLKLVKELLEKEKRLLDKLSDEDLKKLKNEAE